MEKFTLEGGQVSGKTAILEEMKKRGYPCIDEIATQLINEEHKKNVPEFKKIFPWTDIVEFQHRVLYRQLKEEEKANGEQIFIDRGLPSIFAYLRLQKKEIPSELYGHVKNAGYTKSFFLEPIPKRFYNKILKEEDFKIRRDLQYTEKIHNLIRKSYQELEIEIPLVDVPLFEFGKKGIEKRVEFILKNI